MVRLLITFGADVNSKTRGGRTPLHIASTRYSGSMITELLDRGADANIQDSRGWTPFYEAVKYNRTENAQILLPYTNLSLQDNDGKTALEITRSDEMKELISEYLNDPIKEPGEP
jgi:ankyrin repeat protein